MKKRPFIGKYETRPEENHRLADNTILTEAVEGSDEDSYVESSLLSGTTVQTKTIEDSDPDEYVQ